jgi:hypothetical protein
MNETPDDLLHEILPPDDAVIGPRPWLLGRPPGARRGGYWAAVLITACFHGYVLGFLPAVMFAGLLSEPATADTLAEDVEIGIDPDLPIYYNVDRIEDVSIPGAVRPDKEVGITVYVDQPPTMIPPPPGFAPPQMPVTPDGVAGRPSESAKENLTLALAPALAGGFPEGVLDQVPPGAGPTGGRGGPKLAATAFAGESGATRERIYAWPRPDPPVEAARGLQVALPMPVPPVVLSAG